MRIGVIGTGNIGGTLGSALARAGHQVKLGSRSPQDAGSTADAQVTDLAEAIADAEVVLLALPAGGLAEFLAEHGGSLAGKLVVDATNRIGVPVANAAERIAAAHRLPATLARSTPWAGRTSPIRCSTACRPTCSSPARNRTGRWSKS